MVDVVTFLVVIASLSLTLLINVPLNGVLVRFRANHNPKGLQLDPEGGVQPHTGPVVRSYFGMMGRVYRIEGWSGLYKGLMPTILSILVVTAFVMKFLHVAGRHGGYRAPATGVLGTLLYSIMMMLVSLPTVVITYRSITTPRRLSYFKLIHSLRVLLTPTERHRPWTIYLTPGLLAAQVAHIGYVVLGLGPLRRLLVPPPSKTGLFSLNDFNPVKFCVYLLIVLLSTIVLTPLEVIATRLAIQRNHASAEFNSVSQEEEGDADDIDEYAGANEDVIGLRSEADPYLGLVDCAKRIVDEEGWKTLYRAWWMTLLGGVASIFI